MCYLHVYIRSTWGSAIIMCLRGLANFGRCKVHGEITIPGTQAQLTDARIHTTTRSDGFNRGKEQEWGNDRHVQGRCMHARPLGASV